MTLRRLSTPKALKVINTKSISHYRLMNVSIGWSTYTDDTMIIWYVDTLQTDALRWSYTICWSWRCITCSWSWSVDGSPTMMLMPWLAWLRYADALINIWRVDVDVRIWSRENLLTEEAFWGSNLIHSLSTISTFIIEDSIPSNQGFDL